MSCLAIITARGGSKRIPKKNIKEFCGKPIIAYSIEAALDSGIFDEVMVSTDSEEIASIAVQFGAKVPFMRSAETSNDFATTNDVLIEVINEYKSRGSNFDSICCIYPTAPFITPAKLIEGFELMQNGAVSVMPVVKFSFPPQRGLVFRDGILDYREKENSLLRSQDLEPIYHDAGQFYFYRLDENSKFVDGNYSAIILEDYDVQDIDTESDWMIAEAKFKSKRLFLR